MSDKLGKPCAQRMANMLTISFRGSRSSTRIVATVYYAFMGANRRQRHRILSCLKEFWAETSVRDKSSLQVFVSCALPVSKMWRNSLWLAVTHFRVFKNVIIMKMLQAHAFIILHTIFYLLRVQDFIQGFIGN